VSLTNTSSGNISYNGASAGLTVTGSNGGTGTVGITNTKQSNPQRVGIRVAS
jgi:hypothetical protein